MTDDLAEVSSLTHPSPLNDVETFLRRFVSYPSEEAVVAHVLWIAHTHLIDCFDNTPRLAACSPEPGSGKTRLLEMTEPLVPRPVITVNSTPAYVFRKISDPVGKPTLLFDEVDTVFTGKGDASDELRGLLNSGYRRGATAGRAAVRGKEVVTEDWPSFAAVAMAGLNDLPDTLATRSVIIRMKRRKPGEYVEPYRRRVVAPEAEALYDRLAAWAATHVTDVTDSWPDLPEGIEDRDADVWEPLIAVADAAGGEWPTRARTAAVALVAQAHDRPATLGIRLLSDIKSVIGKADRIRSTELLARLHALETAPWASIKGEPIDSRFLSRQLAKYGIPSSHTIRFSDAGNGADTAKGYLKSDFADAFARYVPEIGHIGHTTDASTSAEGAGVPNCTTCGTPLHPILAAKGDTTHPNCEAA
ncbi:DUF3631 domain-containing protein [Pseudolysinimonas sp.]|uniref:DUF3631 domain-containing protein n=1 Tax=Pseudolysinimonas sp. TaxID=2680009 RepID=UPI003F7FFFED